MTIKIQTEETFIPIEIGELEFKFNTLDESIKKFDKNVLNFQKELENISLDSDQGDVLDEAKNILKKGFDLMLGKGAFNEIYAKSPSVLVLIKYFQGIVDGIEVKLREVNKLDSPHDKAKKYLRKK